MPTSFGALNAHLRLQNVGVHNRPLDVCEILIMLQSLRYM
jgi:hypothetical protein